MTKKTQEVKTAIFLTDIHYPHHNKKTIEICLKLAKELKPDYMIYGGDNWDADGISKFTAKDTDEGLVETYEQMNGFKEEIFDKFSQYSKKNILLLGNHDGQRLIDYLNRHLDRSNTRIYNFWNNQFNYKRVFNCDIVPYNDVYKIGNLSFIHGERHNKYHANSHLDILMRNVMYGHLHTTQVHTKVTKGNEPYQAISVPSACELNPDYMKGRASAWINGFAIINFTRNTFHYQIIQIINNETIINGKIYN